MKRYHAISIVLLAAGLCGAASVGLVWAYDKLDVATFGAVGDGIQDDTAALQKALDHAGRMGISLTFSSATYRVRSPLVLGVPTNTRIALASLQGAAIVTDFPNPVQGSEVAKPRANALFAVVGSTASSLEMNNLSFIGHATSTGDIDGVVLDALSEVRLNHIQVTGASRYGLVLTRVQNATLQKCRADHNLWAGLVIDASQNVDVQSGGYAFNGSSGAAVGAGVIVLPSDHGLSRVISLQGIEVSDTQGPGIVIQSGDHITVNGNKIKGFRDVGVYAVSTSTADVLQNITVTNNEIRAGSREVVPEGILVSNADHTVTGSITGNHLYGNFDIPIQADKSIQTIADNRTNSLPGAPPAKSKTFIQTR
jgi:polygalacturonase